MARDRNLQWNELTVKDILELAVADEKDAEAYYLHASRLAGNPRTREMFLNLAEMEHGHASVLLRELEELEAQRECETGMAD
jgi:rubrerythrin